MQKKNLLHELNATAQNCHMQYAAALFLLYMYECMQQMLHVDYVLLYFLIFKFALSGQTT